jgi:hypothetical protein
MSRGAKIVSFGGGVLVVGLIQAEPIPEAHAACGDHQLVSTSERVAVSASGWDGATSGDISFKNDNGITIPRLDFHSLRNDGTNNQLWLVYYPNSAQVSARGCKSSYTTETWSCTSTVSETVAFSSTTLDVIGINLDSIADSTDSSNSFYNAEVWGNVLSTKGLLFELDRAPQENTLRTNVLDFMNMCCW